MGCPSFSPALSASCKVKLMSFSAAAIAWISSSWALAGIKPKLGSATAATSISNRRALGIIMSRPARGCGGAVRTAKLSPAAVRTPSAKRQVWRRYRMRHAKSAPHTSSARLVGLGALFLAFLKVSVCGFGGGLIWARRVVVEQRQWMDDQEFADIFAVSQVMSGTQQDPDDELYRPPAGRH